MHSKRTCSRGPQWPQEANTGPNVYFAPRQRAMGSEPTMVKQPAPTERRGYNKVIGCVLACGT